MGKIYIFISLSNVVKARDFNRKLILSFELRANKTREKNFR